MKISASKLPHIAACLLAGLFTLSAHAQFFDDRDARKAILELRQQMAADKQASTATQSRLVEEVRRSSEENAQLRGNVLDMQSQLEALRNDIARLRAQNDTVARDFAEVQKRQREVVLPLEERLRKLEPFAVTVDGREFQTEASEKREYEGALAVFRRGDFVGAQAAFADFVRRYPNSGFNPSALFWLGNAQYANRDYKGAVANLRAMITTAPNHPRVADALLATANSQIELNEEATARRTLEELVRTYPQSEAAASGRERLAKLK
ncbi:MAG: tol-pal system protein YbgF [Pseudomonadota bacterium]